MFVRSEAAWPKGKQYGGAVLSEIPCLRVANVQRGFLDLDVVKTIEVTSDEAEKYRLRSGDVLMTEGGDWDKLGRAAVWRDELPGCIHQNHVFCIRPRSLDKVLPGWIELVANSPEGRRYFEGASKQTTNLASISKSQLSRFPVPLPPIGQQRRILAVVQDLTLHCRELEGKLASGDRLRSRLLDSLLAEALAPSEPVLA